MESFSPYYDKVIDFMVLSFFHHNMLPRQNPHDKCAFRYGNSIVLTLQSSAN